MKKKKINDGLRNLPKNFVTENELEENIKTEKLRYQVMRRDGFRCQLCGATQADGVKLHVDHIIPVSKGGTSDIGNLRTLCDRCNRGKGDQFEF